MMSPRREVCDRRRLDLFLHNQLPEESQRDLEAHLDYCPACRDNLDKLAGGEPWWTAVRRHLGDDGAAQLTAARFEGNAKRMANVDLSFLKPSNSGASLGRLASYEVLEVVGRGGWGIVLRAFDPALHRPVAIKVLAPEYAANPKARKRFKHEARAMAVVIHDHVVPVHAVDDEATPPFLVMAFIAGLSLQQRIERSAPLELKEVLRIGMQMASGLAAAHALGLVHRDIKPANIMLENGIERVRITDFGLARAVHDASMTQSGAVTGTPQYMSPEQAEGGAVDQRADLFALGSTMYAMATGQPPFQGDSALAIMRQVCDTEPVPISAVNPAMPAWLEGIVSKLLRKDPDHRFQSAAEVAELLEGCLASVQQPDRHRLPVLAARLGREVSAARNPRRYSRRAMAVVVFLGIVASGALMLGPGHRQVQQMASNALTEGPAKLQSKQIQEWVPGNQAITKLNRMKVLQAAEVNELKEVTDGFAKVQSGLEGMKHLFQPTAPSDRIDDVQAKLDDLQHSLSSNVQGGSVDPMTGLRQLNQKAEELRRSFSRVPKLAPDPIDVKMENLRQQLKELQRRVEKG
jgi:eukaryotic-like serine/threonine-protein kinase